jgi:peptidoglycan/LPS O-acetylase OafA/YrhL
LVLSIRKWDSEAKRKKRKVLDYSVSFDIYLIHNKVLMVFATFFHLSTMNSFITYLLLVFVFSFLFFRLRKTCKI